MCVNHKLVVCGCARLGVRVNVGVSACRYERKIVYVRRKRRRERLFEEKRKKAISDERQLVDFYG